MQDHKWVHLHDIVFQELNDKKNMVFHAVWRPRRKLWFEEKTYTIEQSKQWSEHQAMGVKAYTCHYTYAGITMVHIL